MVQWGLEVTARLMIDRCAYSDDLTVVDSLDFSSLAAYTDASDACIAKYTQENDSEQDLCCAHCLRNHRSSCSPTRRTVITTQGSDSEADSSTHGSDELSDQMIASSPIMDLPQSFLSTDHSLLSDGTWIQACDIETGMAFSQWNHPSPVHAKFVHKEAIREHDISTIICAHRGVVASSPLEEIDTGCVVLSMTSQHEIVVQQAGSRNGQTEEVLLSDVRPFHHCLLVATHAAGTNSAQSIPLGKAGADAMDATAGRIAAFTCIATRKVSCQQVRVVEIVLDMDDAIIFVAAKLGGFPTDLPNLGIAVRGNPSPKTMALMARRRGEAIQASCDIPVSSWVSDPGPCAPPTTFVKIPPGSLGSTIRVPHPDAKGQFFSVRIPATAHVGTTIQVPVPDVPAFIRHVHPPHDERCARACRYHIEGRCANGALCRACHHPDHSIGRVRAPLRRRRK